MRLLVLILALMGCTKQESKDASAPLARAQDKADLYLSLQGEAQDQAGFVHDKCDGTLFTALHVIAGGRADLLLARGADGVWYRHADHDCFDAGDSDSDTSNDMLLGVLLWAWATGQPAVVEDLLAYGEEHHWVMGRGALSRTVMRPGLIHTAYQVHRALGGTKPEAQLKDDRALLAFDDHLQVLHTLLDALTGGGVNELQMAVLKAKADSQPRNALFQATYHLFADGDQTLASDLLADDTLFPADRLPRAEDRCEEYLWQRDEAPGDWGPCAGSRPHSGTDLRFALLVAQNKLRRR